MHGASHRVVCRLVFHAYASKRQRAQIVVISCPAEAAHWHSVAFPRPLGGKWQTEFNLKVSHQGTTGAAPLKFLPVVNERVFLFVLRPSRKYSCRITFVLTGSWRRNDG
jgi:hypothetical protein